MTNYELSTVCAEEKRAFLSKGETFAEAPPGLTDKLEAAFEERKNRILASTSDWTVGENGTVYYISSNDGDDSSDGMSPETAWKSIEKLHELQNNGVVKHGDVILFKRGGEWHNKLICAEGITYSAYGEGQKPRILGSTEADRPEQWLETDTPCVYRFDGLFNTMRDVGNIVFNDGECYGMRVMKNTSNMSLNTGSDNLVSNGINKWIFKSRPFSDYRDLAKIADDIPEADLLYYHDRVSGELFLYCRTGNPAERFWSIELCTRGNTVSGKTDVVIDNLCIKYTGSHGVGAGSCKNLTIRNCEIGFIGGSVQPLEPHKTGRFGNAVEIYGAADGFYVYNNYIYQCFDCGPTVQWSGKLEKGQKMIEKDVLFYGNALREAALEVWLTTTEKPTEDTYAELNNCRMFDNFITGSGTGFKAYNHQKYEWCAFYGAEESTARHIDCYMEDNFFWGERRHLMKATPTTTVQGNGFHWRNNVIVHPKDEGSIGWLGESSAVGKGANKQYFYDEKTIKKLVGNGTFGKNYFYYTPGDIKNRRRFKDGTVMLFDDCE